MPKIKEIRIIPSKVKEISRGSSGSQEDLEENLEELDSEQFGAFLEGGSGGDFSPSPSGLDIGSATLERGTDEDRLNVNAAARRASEDDGTTGQDPYKLGRGMGSSIDAIRYEVAAERLSSRPSALLSSSDISNFSAQQRAEQEGAVASQLGKQVRDQMQDHSATTGYRPEDLENVKKTREKVYPWE